MWAKQEIPGLSGFTRNPEPEPHEVQLPDVLPFVLTFSNIGQELRQVCTLRAVSKTFKTAVDTCCSGTIKLQYFVNKTSKAGKLGAWIADHGHLISELDVHMVGGEKERAAIAAGLRAAAAAAVAAPERKLKLRRYVQQTATFPTMISALPAESLTHLDIAPVSRDGGDEPSSPPPAPAATAAEVAAGPPQHQQQQEGPPPGETAAALLPPSSSAQAATGSHHQHHQHHHHQQQQQQQPNIAAAAAAAPQPTLTAVIAQLTNLQSLSIKPPLDWFSYRNGWDFLDITPYLPALSSLPHLTHLHLRQVPPKEQQKTLLPRQLLELTLADGAVKAPLTVPPAGGGGGDAPGAAGTASAGYQLMPVELRLGHLQQLTKLDLFGEAGTIGFIPVGSRVRRGSVLPPKLRELRSLRTQSVEPLLGLKRLEVFDDRYSNLPADDLLLLSTSLPSLKDIRLSYQYHPLHALNAAAAAAPAWAHLSALRELEIRGGGESAVLPVEAVQAVSTLSNLRRLVLGHGFLEGVLHEELADWLKAGLRGSCEELELVGVQVGRYDYKPRGRQEMAAVTRAVSQLRRLRVLRLGVPLVPEAVWPLMAATQLVSCDLVGCGLDEGSAAILKGVLGWSVKDLKLK